MHVPMWTLKHQILWPCNLSKHTYIFERHFATYLNIHTYLQGIFATYLNIHTYLQGILLPI